MEEQLRINKELEDDVEDDLQDLQSILGLGKKEAADITTEITSKAYRYQPKFPPSLVVQLPISYV